MDAQNLHAHLGQEEVVDLVDEELFWVCRDNRQDGLQFGVDSRNSDVDVIPIYERGDVVIETGVLWSPESELPGFDLEDRRIILFFERRRPWINAVGLDQACGEKPLQRTQSWNVQLVERDKRQECGDDGGNHDGWSACFGRAELKILSTK